MPDLICYGKIVIERKAAGAQDAGIELLESHGDDARPAGQLR